MFNIKLTATTETKKKFHKKLDEVLNTKNTNNLEYRISQLWTYVTQMTRHAFLLGQKYPDIIADEVEELLEEEEDKQ